MIRRIAPRCARSQDPEHAIKDATVVHPRNATRLVRQHGLDGNPFMFGEFVAYDSSPSNLNQGDLVRRNASRQAPISRLLSEADIGLLTIPLETAKISQRTSHLPESQINICD